MSDETAAEVVVVGLGPGGEDLAGRLAEAGLDVIGVDGGLVGGECPYWGCVPSKMMIRSADLLAEGHRINGMAGEAVVTPEWAPVATRIRKEATDDWDDRVAVERLEHRGARFVRGWARLDGPGRVVVGEGRVLTATRGVVLACGAKAWAPPVEGLAGSGFWNNRDAIETTSVPESLVVLGGGAIGVELGQVFARFGSRVTIVEGGERLVALEEPEASALIEEVLARDGVEIVTGAGVERVRKDGEGFALDLTDRAPVTGERLLVATGRRPDLAALNVSSIGVDESARSVPVDGHMRVTDGVWALGDITGKGAFTHVSMYQARIAVRSILGQEGPEAEYEALPRVTFTDPEVGSVGMTEAAARAAGLSVRVGMTSIPASSRGYIHKAGNDGFIKLVCDASRGVLVGATTAGPNGGEVLGFVALAVHAAVPIARLRHMIYAYPTFHRAIEAALDDLDL
jgi:pyruvate/2-oxoglutarate dehydrogenase complex dihydrolipoamide dehydrogenase (E3) component